MGTHFLEATYLRKLPPDSVRMMNAEMGWSCKKGKDNHDPLST